MRSFLLYRILLKVYGELTKSLNSEIRYVERDDLKNYSSPFLDRLACNRDIEVAPTICAWSDLLGFGTPFIESKWSPNDEQWRTLASRIERAYRLHLQNLSPGEFILLLNDGAVRTRMLDQLDLRIGWVAFWMRHVVKAHTEVNYAERQLGLPGTRTVIAVGVRASYAFPEVRLQDLFYHSMGRDKRSSAEYSTLLVHNPDALQLNTAFSKAYILDSYGSKKGLAGSGLFVDDSVFQALKVWSRGSPTLNLIDERRGNHRFYGVQDSSAKPGGQQGLIGFLCEQPPISITETLLSTDVHRVVRYFTDDEDWEEFSFDLI